MKYERFTSVSVQTYVRILCECTQAANVNETITLVILKVLSSITYTSSVHVICKSME